MTTFHGQSKSATLDRRTLTVTTDAGTVTEHETLADATLKALAYVAAQMTDATQIDGMDRPEHGRCLIIAHALTHAERLAQQAREIID